MISRFKTVGLTTDVNIAILLAKRVGLIKPKIAVKGAVVTVTVGAVIVTGAFPYLIIGSTRKGEETGRGKDGITKDLPGRNILFKKRGSTDHGEYNGKKGDC